jgi:hypothetical protein
MFFIRKASLSALLSMYDGVGIPEHWQVGLDVHGTYGRKFPDVPMRILEASLYEDMAALFNLAHRATGDAEQDTSSKVLLKHATALTRACATAAYHFVEAYLNGVAFDHLAKVGGVVDKKTSIYLSEWDPDAERPRWIKTRDKLVNYPRLILGLEHPPLQENNCPEMKSFLETTKPIRDALAHASPTVDAHTLEPAKEYAIFGLKFHALEPMVDSAVAVVEVIEKTLTGDRRRIAWLYGRGNDGLFPDVAFE